MSTLPTYAFPAAGVRHLSAEEQVVAQGLVDQLAGFAVANYEANAYYEATKVLSSPGFTIPQEVASRLAPVAGAPGIVVDVLEERLDFLGWDEFESDLGLAAVYDGNELDAEGAMLHLDALVYGTSFARVGLRPDGSVAVTTHSPTTTTGLRDPSTRRLSAAWTTLGADKSVERGVLDLPYASITMEAREGGHWTVVDRDDHNLGRVPVVQFANRPRSSRRGGRSEITAAIRSLTEDMMRAGLGMNVNTMFYSIPQLMILGRGPDAFVDRNGNPVPGWKILAGHALALGLDDEGNRPDVKQLNIASPAPFIDQLREFRMSIAAEAGMPADFMGIQTANPPSADAIRAGEARLVKRAERRQTGFGRSWQEVARLAVLSRDGEIPPDFDSTVAVDWRAANTPTRAATADEVAKLVSVGVMAPDSAVVRKRLQLSRSEERLLEKEQRRSRGAAVLERLAPVTDGNG